MAALTLSLETQLSNRSVDKCKIHPGHVIICPSLFTILLFNMSYESVMLQWFQ